MNEQLQFGDVNEQVRFAAEQIANITELQGGFDAIGFSQGQSCSPVHKHISHVPTHFHPLI